MTTDAPQPPSLNIMLPMLCAFTFPITNNLSDSPYAWTWPLSTLFAMYNTPAPFFTHLFSRYPSSSPGGGNVMFRLLSEQLLCSTAFFPGVGTVWATPERFLHALSASQSPAPSTLVLRSHSHCPSAQGQGIPIKDVSIHRNNVAPWNKVCRSHPFSTR